MEQEKNAGCYSTLEPDRGAITAGGLEWHYLEWSVAKPEATLLLLHGICSSAWSWWRVGPALAERGIRVIAPDMPGHGYTDPMPTSYRLEATSKAITFFAKSFGLEKMLLAGHSWGGANALLIAAQNLLPLSRVVLIDPALWFGNREWAEQTSKNFTTLIGQPFEVSYATMRADLPSWHECDIYWRAKSLEKVQLSTVQNFFFDNVETKLVDQLSQISVPFSLLLGDTSLGGVVSSSQEKAARAYLKPGQDVIKRQPGVGHNLHREDYTQFMASFVPFLES